MSWFGQVRKKTKGGDVRMVVGGDRVASGGSEELGDAAAGHWLEGGGQGLNPLAWDNMPSALQEKFPHWKGSPLDPKSNPQNLSGDEESSYSCYKASHQQPDYTFPYVVMDNDTLNSIAVKFETTPAELARLNKKPLGPTSMIFTGQVLYIPDHDEIARSAPKSAPPIISGVSGHEHFQSSVDSQDTLRSSSVSHPLPESNMVFGEEAGSEGVMEEEEAPAMAPAPAVEGNDVINEGETGGQELFEEIAESHLVLVSRYITDDQGCVHGNLMINHTAIMFTPFPSETLVKEHGSAIFEIMIPIQDIIFAAFATDVNPPSSKRAALLVAEDKTDQSLASIPTQESFSYEDGGGGGRDVGGEGKSGEGKVEGEDEVVESVDKEVESRGVGNEDIDGEVKIEVESEDKGGEEMESDGRGVESEDKGGEDEDIGGEKVESEEEKVKDEGRAIKEKLGESQGENEETPGDALQSSEDHFDGFPSELVSSGGSQDDVLKHPHHHHCRPNHHPPHHPQDQQEPTSTDDLLAIMGANCTADEHRLPRQHSYTDQCSVDSLLSDQPCFLHIKVSHKCSAAHTYTPLNLGIGIDIPNNQHISPARNLVQQVKIRFCFAVAEKRVVDLVSFISKHHPSMSGGISNLPSPSNWEEGCYQFITLEDSVAHEELHFSDNHFKGAESSESWEIFSLKDVQKYRYRIDKMEVEAALPLPVLSEPSSLMDESHLRALSNNLLSAAVGHDWFLIYSTFKHGISLRTLYRNMHMCELPESPVILLVRDDQNKLFGAALTAPLKLSEKFYGTGESFLFSFESSELQVYPWTGENNYIVKGSPDSICVGCGNGHAGLWLDEYLLNGSSEDCATFGNSCLSSSPEFTCTGVEAWGFLYH